MCAMLKNETEWALIDNPYSITFDGLFQPMDRADPRGFMGKTPLELFVQTPPKERDTFFSRKCKQFLVRESDLVPSYTKGLVLKKKLHRNRHSQLNRLHHLMVPPQQTPFQSLPIGTSVKRNSICLKCSYKKTKFVSLNIYRPPNQTVDQLEQFFDILSTNLDKLADYDIPLYVTGDFNLDILKSENLKQQLQALNRIIHLLRNTKHYNKGN